MSENVLNIPEVRIWGIVPAAGSGQRMCSERPKQYLKIDNKTVLELTLNKFLSTKNVFKLVVALDPDDKYWKNIESKFSTRVLDVVDGGNTRQESVFNALKKIRTHILCENNFLDQGVSQNNNLNHEPNQETVFNKDWVLIHDAARPCVSINKINDLIKHALLKQTASILAFPATHTVKVSLDGETIKQSANREHLWLANTPQIFPFNILYDCLSRAEKKKIRITDEASALETFGYSVGLVQDRQDNIKITLPEDLALAEMILSQEKLD